MALWSALMRLRFRFLAGLFPGPLARSLSGQTRGNGKIDVI